MLKTIIIGRQLKKLSSFQRIPTTKFIYFENNNILYYTGRILPEQNVSYTVTLAGVMKYLSTSTFRVPMIDTYEVILFTRYSLLVIFYSLLVNE